MHQAGGRFTPVVKSIHVRGATDRYGELQVEIDRHDADLSQGRWVSALASLIVTPVGSTGFSIDVPVCVSASHTYASICSGRGRHISAPARQALFVLEHQRVGPTLVTCNSNWLEILKPTNAFHLIFQHAESDKIIPNLSVQALVLFSRVVVQ